MLFKHSGLFDIMYFIIASANIVVSAMYPMEIYFFLCTVSRVFVHNYTEFVEKGLVKCGK